MLSECDIVTLLGDNDVSDICSEVDELEDDNYISIDEFDNLLDFIIYWLLDDSYPEIVSDFDIEPDFMSKNKRDFIGLL